jgi:uncharacterized protein
VRVVLDANVFVSAVIQNGASHRIVQDWLAGVARFDVVMCPELLAEIRDVLTTRRRLRKWVELGVAVAFVDTIEALVDFVEDPEFIEAEIRDPGDDYLVALARENDVEMIVSGDKDLLEWAAQRPPVVTPADFEGRLLAMD